ncbi:MAG: L,D-transpeptidase [Candidatus Humimicrobiaceae bacterium]
MQNTLKKITAVFIIIILAVFIAGCSIPKSNSFDTDNSTLKSQAVSEDESRNLSSDEGNPGDSGSLTIQENTDNSTDSRSSIIEPDNEVSLSDLQDKEDVINDSDEDLTQAQVMANELPELFLEIIEGPVALEDNSLCYYRIKANVKGNPLPVIYFSKDDSNGAWGSNVVQVNLAPGETYELIVKASNSSGQANASVILSWQSAGIQSGQTNIVAEEANPGNYFIKVSLDEQKVRVFYKNDLLKEMICSSGAPLTPTPKGTFKTSDKIKYAWLPKFNVGAYYFVRFYGSYLFHSTPFDKEGNMIEEEKLNLGKPVSHGCIRLDLDEEKWLYETVPSGVTVEIY